MRSELRQSFCCRCSNSASSKALFPEIPLPLNVSRIFQLVSFIGLEAQLRCLLKDRPFSAWVPWGGKTCCRRSHFELFLPNLTKLSPLPSTTIPSWGNPRSNTFFSLRLKRKWEAVWVVVEAPKCSKLPPTKSELSSKTKSTKNCHRVTFMGITSEVRC